MKLLKGSLRRWLGQNTATFGADSCQIKRISLKPGIDRNIRWLFMPQSPHEREEHRRLIELFMPHIGHHDGRYKLMHRYGRCGVVFAPIRFTREQYRCISGVESTRITIISAFSQGCAPINAMRGSLCTDKHDAGRFVRRWGIHVLRIGAEDAAAISALRARATLLR